MRRIATLALCLLVLLPSSRAFEGAEGGGSNDFILKAGVQAGMVTTNILNSNVRMSFALMRCYDTVLKTEPFRVELIPYILTGTETNGIAGFQSEESGVFGFLPGSDDEAIAYYDFTNARFHDGEQVDIMDVIFSYHIFALHPSWSMTASPLMDNGGVNSNYSNDRWLWVWEIDDGDGSPLTAAARFRITTTYHKFWSDTMNILLLPRHVWEGTGKIRNSDGTYRVNIHDDFGRAVDPDSNGLGVNDARNPGWKEFDMFTGAMDWEPKQDEIIGTGMFEFAEIVQGSHSKVIRYEGYLEKLAAKPPIHKPYIEGIEFIDLSTPERATMALKKGEIDIILWSIPSDFIHELQGDPNIALLFAPDLGFSYLGHNLNSAILGYKNDDPAQGDAGKPLRQAIAHLVDKKTFSGMILQGYAIPADGPVNPQNTLWYNASLPHYDYSPDTAKSILDSNGYIDNNGDGWRDLDPTTPGDQDSELTINSPYCDYDSAKAQICILIAENLKNAGINARCGQLSFFALADIMYERKYDMAVNGWSVIETDPTSMLYWIFHSEGDGNYAGYKSMAFDNVITRAMNEIDLYKRQVLVKWAQGILVEDLPINVLYFMKNVISYRLNRLLFEIYDGEGILNYWSLMNARLSGPGLGFFDILSPSIRLASAAASNSTEIVSVSVHINKSKYGYAKPAIGAKVALKTSDGYITPSNGTTNANGNLAATFHAPYVPPYYEQGLKVFISVSVDMEWYESYTVTTLIVVFPEGVKFLSATIDLPLGDLLDEGDTALIDILIRDEYKFPIDNATVAINSDPFDAKINPSIGTTIGGRLENVDFTAPEVDEDTLYKITVNASKPDYVGANVSVSIYVLDDRGPVCPDCGTPDSIFRVLLLAAIFVAVAAIMVSLGKPDNES